MRSKARSPGVLLFPICNLSSYNLISMYKRGKVLKVQTKYFRKSVKISVLGGPSFLLSLLIGFGMMSPAQAAEFTFSQSGWLGEGLGGTVQGSFSGSDANSDGTLQLSELTSYEANFSGAQSGISFNHNLLNLDFFEFTLGSSGFPPSFPLFSNDGSFGYDADDQTIFDQPFGQGIIFSTREPARVVSEPSAVPEPSALFGLLTLAGLGLAMKRKRSLVQKEVKI